MTINAELEEKLVKKRCEENGKIEMIRSLLKRNNFTVPEILELTGASEALVTEALSSIQQENF